MSSKTLPSFVAIVLHCFSTRWSVFRKWPAEVQITIILSAIAALTGVFSLMIALRSPEPKPNVSDIQLKFSKLANTDNILIFGGHIVVDNLHGTMACSLTNIDVSINEYRCTLSGILYEDGVSRGQANITYRYTHVELPQNVQPANTVKVELVGRYEFDDDSELAKLITIGHVNAELIFQFNTGEVIKKHAELPFTKRISWLHY